MKYYCEECGKIYDTEDDVKKCELKHTKSKEKEIRWKEVCKAKSKYEKLYMEYVNDYGERVKRVKYYLPFELFSEMF